MADIYRFKVTNFIKNVILLFLLWQEYVFIIIIQFCLSAQYLLEDDL